MFPIRDENPTRHTSLATFMILAINIACWVLVQKLGTSPGLIRSICNYGLIPGNLLGRLPPGTEIKLGHGIACVITGDTAQWITLVTSMFMHGGWLHIIGNMWFLAVFGDNVEDAMGPFRFILFYLACGLAAALAQVALAPSSTVPMVGASGAIGGVMAAYAILYPTAPVHMLVFLGFLVTRIVVPAFLMLGYWFLMQMAGILLYGPSGGGTAFGAHAGGFITGLVLARIMCNPQRLARCRGKRGRTGWRIRRY